MRTSQVRHPHVPKAGLDDRFAPYGAAPGDGGGLTVYVEPEQLPIPVARGWREVVSLAVLRAVVSNGWQLLGDTPGSLRLIAILLRLTDAFGRRRPVVPIEETALSAGKKVVDIAAWKALKGMFWTGMTETRRFPS